MNPTPHVNPSPQDLPRTVAPTQNPDGSNALPSTTTDQGAELAPEESMSVRQSSLSPSSGQPAAGGNIPGLHQPADDQTAATPTPDDPPVEAGEI